MNPVVFADSFFGLEIPFGHVLLPVLAGITAAGLAVAVLNLLQRRPVPALPPPPGETEKKAGEFDPFLHGSATEQRRALRRTGNPIEVYLAPSHSKVSPATGWVIDRSVGGLCLHVAQEYQAGDLLDVIPTNAPPLTPWVAVEVKSCRPSKEGWQIGCQFVKSPPWGVLLLFG